MSDTRTRNRGALYVMIAVLTYLQSALKADMTAHDWKMLVIGTLLAGAVTLRAYIDKTPAEGDGALPVQVTNSPDKPVPTTETR